MTPYKYQGVRIWRGGGNGTSKDITYFCFVGVGNVKLEEPTREEVEQDIDRYFAQEAVDSGTR